MRRIALVFSFISAVGLTTACSGPEQREERQEAALEVGDRTSGEELTVTGCLTGTPDQNAFVVTASRDALTSGAIYAGDGETPTYTYELVGNSADLAQHVGRQVEVRGHVDDDRDDEVKVDKEEETELEPRRSGDDTVRPAIETDTEARINVRRLRVSTITPTGQPCLPSQP